MRRFGRAPDREHYHAIDDAISRVHRIKKFLSPSQYRYFRYCINNRNQHRSLDYNQIEARAGELNRLFELYSGALVGRPPLRRQFLGRPSKRRLGRPMPAPPLVLAQPGPDKFLPTEWSPEEADEMFGQAFGTRYIEPLSAQDFDAALAAAKRSRARPPMYLRPRAFSRVGRGLQRPQDYVMRDVHYGDPNVVEIAMDEPLVAPPPVLAVEEKYPEAYPSELDEELVDAFPAVFPALEPEVATVVREPVAVPARVVGRSGKRLIAVSAGTSARKRPRESIFQ